MGKDRPREAAEDSAEASLKGLLNHDGAARLYGRAKGHSLSPRALRLMRDHLPRLRLDLAQPAPEKLTALFPKSVDAVVLEIGFGGGEHLVAGARNTPRVGFIGSEPFVNGVAKLVRAVVEHDLDNVRIHDHDARDLLDWLPSESVDRIDLLYPDPWPKKRHWKRRFVNAQSLDRLARVLRPGGAFRFASDIDSYIAWTLFEVRRHGRFSWQASTAADWRTPWPGWPGTRYEAKALREGRRGHYLTFLLAP